MIGRERVGEGRFVEWGLGVEDLQMEDKVQCNVYSIYRIQKVVKDFIVNIQKLNVYVEKNQKVVGYMEIWI